MRGGAEQKQLYPLDTIFLLNWFPVNSNEGDE